MGIDLVSACVFCAGMLLGMDLPPRDGPRRGDGLLLRDARAALRRRDRSGSTPRTSRRSSSSSAWATPGPRRTVSAPGRRASSGGRGSPSARRTTSRSARRSTELGLPDRRRRAPAATRTSPLLRPAPGRRRATPSSSPSTGARRAPTDLINIGGENQEVTEPRDPLGRADRLAARLAPPLGGARGRGGLPVDRSPTGYNATAGSFQNASGTICGGDGGGALEPRRAGRSLLHGEGMGGQPRRPPREPPRLRRPRRVAAGVLRGGAPRRRLFLAADGPVPHGDLRPPEAAVRVARRARDGDRRVRPGLRSRFQQRGVLLRPRVPLRLHARRSAPRVGARLALGRRDRDADATPPASCRPQLLDVHAPRAFSAAAFRPLGSPGVRPSSSARTSRSARRAP